MVNKRFANYTNLTDNDLHDAGVIAISDAPKGGVLNIKTLALPSNKIGVEGVAALANSFDFAKALLVYN